MLILGSALIDEMVAHARERHPIEACGIIAGPPGTERPTRLIRMRNVLESPMAYQFDPAEQMAVFRQMDARGEDSLVIYHSHTASRPIPSGDDTRFALEPGTQRPLHPDAHYVIVSTRDSGHIEIRSWRPTGRPAIDLWRPEAIQVDDVQTPGRDRLLVYPHSGA